MAAAIPLKLDSGVLQPIQVASRRSTHNGSSREVLMAEHYLCDVLNRFPTPIHATIEGPFELPPLDLESIGRGIKRILYSFLRMEYLRPRGRLGLGSCRNPKCNKLFVKERRGAVYCCVVCSHRDRALKQYHESGRAKRQARRHQDQNKSTT
jgi:hypothetical protein